MPGQLRPVLRVARQPGRFEAQDDADVTQRHLGHHALEAGTLSDAGGRDAEVVHDGDGVAPAERHTQAACESALSEVREAADTSHQRLLISRCREEFLDGRPVSGWSM